MALSSKSNAAKMPHHNSGLSKKFGTPHNVSDCSGGRSTQAASRAAVNGTITGKKFFEQPNDYGHGVGK